MYFLRIPLASCAFANEHSDDDDDEAVSVHAQYYYTLCLKKSSHL